MNKLAAFLLVLATDAAVAQSFNNGDDAAKEAMLQQAGVENATEVLALGNDELKQLLSDELIAQTGAWQNLAINADNDDQKNNIGRLGLNNR